MNTIVRTSVVAIAYALLTGGLLAVLVYQLRAEAIAAGKKELAAFAQLTAGHTFEVAIGVEEALNLADLTIGLATSAGAVDREAVDAMLLDVVKNTRVLQDIIVLGADGKVAFAGKARDEVGSDRSTQPYFARFKNDPAIKFGIGAALREVTGTRVGWSIPMIHVRRDTQGRFEGLIIGFIDPQYFAKVWTFDSAIEGLSISLTNADGTAITQHPFMEADIGQAVVDSTLLSSRAPGVSGAAFVAKGRRDGTEQLVAWRGVAAYPDLAVVITQPLSVVLAGWQSVALLVGGGWLVASLALGGLGAWLAREIWARGVLEDRYHALFDSIPHSVIVIDEGSLQVVAFNDAAARQYGWVEEGDSGRVQASLPADYELLLARRAKFSKDASTMIEGQRHRNGAGQLIDVDVTVRPINYHNKSAILVIAVDVTDRMQAERERQATEHQLRQSQKMDVLGQLTGGIAHDFNNILMVIQSNTESLLEQPEHSEDSVKQLTQVLESAERAEELTRQMLAFSRKQPLRPRPTSVNDLVVDTGKLLRRTLGEQIEIDAVLADDLWKVSLDRVQFETSLVNLCLNARDAMPNGGRVLIETRNAVLDGSPGVGIPADITGDHVLVSVIDTGSGITRENLDKIFEPFFSTKLGGRGSGLGLSMVYGFVRQSKGHIAVTSEVGQGTSVWIYLPRHIEEASAAETLGPSTGTVGGTERVLVVEDDEHVRRSVVKQLKSLGYDVGEAANAELAVEAVKAAETPYELLLTDVIMPGALNGKELAEVVSRLRPDTKIVFMSGYSDSAFDEQKVLLLNKPFRKSDLAQMLRLALDREQATTEAS